MANSVYLDHNATTPLRDEALDAMMPYLTARFGNASSPHAYGRDAREAVESARDSIASCIGASPSEIVFTSGGTEADNLALRGVVEAHTKSGRAHLLTSAVEHHAVLEIAHALEGQSCTLSVVGVDRHAMVDPDAVRAAVRSETVLGSVMLANNEIGTIQPIRAVAEAVRERGALFHTDAVQGVGRVPVDVDALGVDLLSMSAHKFGGPKGVGALYVRRGVTISPIQRGGSQERNIRPGTENVPGIVGMAAALRCSLAEMEDASSLLCDLGSYFASHLHTTVQGVHVNTPEHSVPGTVNVSFEGVDAELLIVGLDMEGISVSSGSACASGAMEASHVLAAMGLPDELAAGTVRFSFGRGNTLDDATHTLGVLDRLIRRARKHVPQ